jgi:hypothetical protein
MHKTIEIGDLLFCHTVGNKYGFQVNQLGIVIESALKNSGFRIFLGSGKISEVTQADLEKGNVEIISKAQGTQVKTNLKIIPSFPDMLKSKRTSYKDKNRS